MKQKRIGFQDLLCPQTLNGCSMPSNIINVLQERRKAGLFSEVVAALISVVAIYHYNNYSGKASLL